jgi:nicotinamide-nucleotide amidase
VEDVEFLVKNLSQRLLERRQMLATAESCTGGMIAAACTDLAGSSAWFERGFVTYSNEAKTELLGVGAALINAHGAVSEPVARAMAEGALRRSHAHFSVAVTGVAGPSGGSAAKPVGTVWFAWGWRDSIDRVAEIHLKSERMLFSGDRAGVRLATVQHALSHVSQLVAGASATRV